MWSVVVDPRNVGSSFCRFHSGWHSLRIKFSEIYNIGVHACTVVKREPGIPGGSAKVLNPPLQLLSQTYKALKEVK